MIFVIDRAIKKIKIGDTVILHQNIGTGYINQGSAAHVRVTRKIGKTIMVVSVHQHGGTASYASIEDTSETTVTLVYAKECNAETKRMFLECL